MPFITSCVTAPFHSWSRTSSERGRLTRRCSGLASLAAELHIVRPLGALLGSRVLVAYRFNPCGPAGTWKESGFLASPIAPQRLGRLRVASRVVPRAAGYYNGRRSPTQCAASRHGAWASKPYSHPHRLRIPSQRPVGFFQRCSFCHPRWPHAAKRHSLSSLVRVPQRPHRVTGPSRLSNSLGLPEPPSPRALPPLSRHQSGRLRSAA